jgi:putative flippase GtrA
MKYTSREFSRFLISGGTNTVATYILYLWLLLFTGYEIAYTVSFVAGIVLAYALGTYFVFRTQWSWKKFAQFPLVYILQYGAGMSMMWLLVERMGMDDRIAPLIIIVVLIPLTFVLTRKIIDTDRAH